MHSVVQSGSTCMKWAVNTKVSNGHNMAVQLSAPDGLQATKKQGQYVYGCIVVYDREARLTRCL